MKWFAIEVKLFYMNLKIAITKTKFGRKISGRYNKTWILDILCIIEILLMIFVAYLVLYLLLLLLTITYYKAINLNINKDSWLNFAGTLIGGFATMIGVIWTIKYERKRDENNRLKQAQPILILQNAKDIADIQGFKDNLLSSSKESKPFIVYFHDITIENIGYNVALDISIYAKMYPFLNSNTKGIKKLYPGTAANAELIMFTYEYQIIKDMKIYKKLMDSQITQRLLDEIYLRECLGDKFDLVEQRVSYRGSIILACKDLYHTDYKQEFESKFHIIKMKDGFLGFLESNFLSNS